jgi:hypothetical protein
MFDLSFTTINKPRNEHLVYKNNGVIVNTYLVMESKGNL